MRPTASGWSGLMAPDASGEPNLVVPHHAAAFVRTGLLQQRKFRRVVLPPQPQPPGTASSRPPAAAGGGRGQIGTLQTDPGKEQPDADPPDLPDLLPSEEESEKLDWGLG